MNVPAGEKSSPPPRECWRLNWIGFESEEDEEKSRSGLRRMGGGMLGLWLRSGVLTTPSNSSSFSRSSSDSKEVEGEVRREESRRRERRRY